MFADDTPYSLMLTATGDCIHYKGFGTNALFFTYHRMDPWLKLEDNETNSNT